MVAFERGERRSRKLRRAHRDDAPDGFLAEAAKRELDYGRRRSIEPLEVVDRAYDLRLAGQRAQQREKSGSDDPTFGRPCRSGAEERGVETDPLRLGQSCEELVGHVGEQIREPREAKPGFRLGRPCDQHAGAVRTSTLDRRLPQRRLADSRLAADRQGAGPLGGQEESRRPPAPTRARPGSTRSEGMCCQSRRCLRRRRVLFPCRLRVGGGGQLHRRKQEMSTQSYANNVNQTSGWTGFAAVVLYAVGFFRIIEAISYFANSHKINNLTGGLFGGQNWAWGLWDLLIAVVAIMAASSVLKGGVFGRLIGYFWGAARHRPVARDRRLRAVVRRASRSHWRSRSSTGSASRRWRSRDPDVTDGVGGRRSHRPVFLLTPECRYAPRARV